MEEQNSQLTTLLRAAVAPGFRNRLLDRGVARGLIWDDGNLPDGAPPFSNSLTDDLLDYAYTLMTLALRRRSEEPGDESAARALLVAGQSIQAAVHRGDQDRLDQGFHRVNAAVAFHLAGYPTMAYSIVPAEVRDNNLAPTEFALVLLFRRQLGDLKNLVSSWLHDAGNLDRGVALRLRDDVSFDHVDAAHTLIATSFMRGLALFDHAITVGDPESAGSARDVLRVTAAAAEEMNFVSHWWTCTLASHLIEDLWDLSLHQRLPTLPPNDHDYSVWNSLRVSYIQRLLNTARPTVELWPSQLEAAKRSIDVEDNLVVALPTSAGKTRIAELCILRALASDRRVIYVTPLRALSAQVETDLAQTFVPLGFSVSSLYGSVGIESGDAETLVQGHIVVSTPEKLNFALRNDPTVIDDVGLIVLDEGHMLGPGEREVRYEVLIEGLLSREDAQHRRIVCLSALFPDPGEMTDLVEWIRQDVTGNSVHANWRPTRQRFGTLQWLSDAAQLDMKVDSQNSYIPRFIEQRKPPKGSRRRNPFPNDKKDLTLAAGWRFVRQGQRVLVYCPLRRSVDSLGKHALTLIRQGLLSPLQDMNVSLQNAINAGIEWLGSEHPAVKCLQYGIALHHGGLPRAFQNEVERLLRSGDCPLTIASPTLAQGLNLSASVLLMPSIWRSKEVIPSGEFVNVAGRAGRAFVDLEGLVLHIVWEDKQSKRRWALGKWDDLVNSSGSMQVVSGLLELTIQICLNVSAQAGVPFSEVLEYVTGNASAWDFNSSPEQQSNTSQADWESDIASFDSAILALLGPGAEESTLESGLSKALNKSLFSRRLIHRESVEQTLLPRVIAERARHIWSRTNEVQRRGYYFAGVGYQAGALLDTILLDLVGLLLEAEKAINDHDVPDLVEAIVEFAGAVLKVAPFRPQRPIPDGWQEALTAWFEGRSGSIVIDILGSDGVDFLHDTISYRLPWAMEAVRVHATAVGIPGSEELTGMVAMATEAGSADISVITLIRSGLRSREAAVQAAARTGALFKDRTGLEAWLASREVQSQRRNMNWPTSRTHNTWEQFYQRERRHRTKWERKSALLKVEWFDTPPPSGSYIVLEENPSANGAIVLSPDLRELGHVKTPLNRPFGQIVGARIGDDPNMLTIEFFGPE